MGFWVYGCVVEVRAGVYRASNIAFVPKTGHSRPLRMQCCRCGVAAVGLMLLLMLYPKGPGAQLSYTLQNSNLHKDYKPKKPQVGFKA